MSAIEAEATRERMKIMQDGLINCSGSVLSGALSVILVPLMLHSLGAESYGVLVTATVLIGTASAMDFGLDWSVTREVAVAESGASGRESDVFVKSARTAYVIFAVIVALLMTFAGHFGTRLLHVTAANPSDVQLVFALAGLTFIGDRISALSIAVLTGVRRFKLVNALMVAAGLLRAAGIFAILAGSRSIVDIAIWQTAVSILGAAASTFILHHESSRFRLRFGRIDWQALKRYASSNLYAAFALALVGIYWQTPQLLVSGTRGASALAVYYTALRFPLVILLLASRAALALFPATAKHSHGEDVAVLRVLLDAGTRWIAVITLPLCIVLYIIAPALLQAWVHSADAEVVLIVRLSVVAVFLDALSGGAMEVLWGFGVPKQVLMTMACATVLNWVMGAVLIDRVGLPGAAISMLVTVTCTTTALLLLAAPRCGMSVPQLLSSTFRGFPLPALACALVTWALLQPGAGPGWAAISAICLLAGITFFLTLYLTGARAEERRFVREILDSVRVGNSA